MTNYCPHCEKTVNTVEEDAPYSLLYDLKIISCEECHNFLYQYLEEKD